MQKLVFWLLSHRSLFLRVRLKLCHQIWLGARMLSLFSPSHPPSPLPHLSLYIYKTGSRIYVQISVCSENGINLHIEKNVRKHFQDQYTVSITVKYTLTAVYLDNCKARSRVTFTHNFCYCNKMEISCCFCATSEILIQKSLHFLHPARHFQFGSQKFYTKTGFCIKFEQDCIFLHIGNRITPRSGNFMTAWMPEGEPRKKASTGSIRGFDYIKYKQRALRLHNVAGGGVWLNQTSTHRGLKHSW